jgi:uncharacterized membrane-anchored protein
MSDRLATAIQTAQAQGLLPADAVPPDADARPWPVVLLTALGAWLAAGPLLGVVGMLLGPLLSAGVGPYIVGALVLGGAVVVLRSPGLPIFVEQLAVPALLTGGGTLAFGLFRDLPPQLAAGLLALLALAIGRLVQHAWLRVLLGAAAAALAGFALVPERLLEASRLPHLVFWLMLHGLLAAWLGALALQRSVFNQGRDAPAAAAVESIGAGWLLVTLAGLAWLAGMTMLVGGSTGGGLVGAVVSELGPRARQAHGVIEAGSAVLAAGAAAFLGWRAPGLRSAPALCVAAVITALAWLMPTLGGVCVVLAVTLATQRWRLGGAAAVALAWIIGGFYYQLQWTLADKGLMLLAAGALLAALAWWKMRRSAAGTVPAQATCPAPGTSAAPAAAASAPQPPSRATGVTDAQASGAQAPSAAPPAQETARMPALPAATGRRPALLIAVAGVATLAVANLAIWQKETLIATGRPVFVELAPVDPRSLMQGDYMRLNFRLPDSPVPVGALRGAARPVAVGRLDERGIVRFSRMDTGLGDAAGSAAAANEGPEVRIRLAPKDGRWTLVTDAWFFSEGDGRRWEAARYGEFRVGADGQALLVGLADAQLQRIGR